MVKTQAAQIMPCQHTSFIESIIVSWRSPSGCSSRITTGSWSALDLIVDACHAREFGASVPKFAHQIALEDIQHLGTTLETGVGESLCSFPKSQRRLPDLLHLPVDAQQRAITKKFGGEFLWQGG